MSIENGEESDFQRALMEKGFYPENLPPVFVVKNFYDAAVSLKLFDKPQMKKPLSLARYNATKRGGQRRVFATPNPLFFIDVAAYLAVNRSELAPILDGSKMSCSVPRFDSEFSRAIRIDSFPEFIASRRTQLASFRYIVKADISRFFPSIYTHSIPWAVHGKSEAKHDRDPDSKNNYANKLDQIVRQAQDKQTMGIPVGPDTSRIISELIMGAIDKKFREEKPKAVGVRLVDDVYLGAETFKEAENLLSAYRNAIRYFELDINESKTHIFEAKQDLESFWPVEIRREIKQFAAFRFLPRQVVKADLTSYLDEIIRIANRENDDGVLKHAIRKMDDSNLWDLFWDSLEPFLIRVAVNFPHCLDYVARVVVWKRRRDNTIDSRKWRDVCRSIIAYHAPLGNDSEVVWACWMLKEIEEKLPSRLCGRIFKYCGPFAALLAIDLEDNGLVAGKFPKNLVDERIGSNPMTGNDWLLSYEAERSFGYPLKKKNCNDYVVFGKLIEKGAQFYDPMAEPVVFQNDEDPESVDKALEKNIGLYEDDEMGEYEASGLNGEIERMARKE